MWKIPFEVARLSLRSLLVYKFDSLVCIWSNAQHCFTASAFYLFTLHAYIAEILAVWLSKIIMYLCLRLDMTSLHGDQSYLQLHGDQSYC